jgi:hypothetical protein
MKPQSMPGVIENVSGIKMIRVDAVLSLAGGETLE